MFDTIAYFFIKTKSGKERFAYEKNTTTQRVECLDVSIVKASKSSPRDGNRVTKDRWMSQANINQLIIVNN